MINKCTLLGRLARDPEIKEFQNGGKVCKLRLITSRSYPDSKSGEFQERTEGHNIAIYVDKLAERIHDKCRKGDILFVEGSLETRKWTDHNSVTHYMTEIVIRPRIGGIRRLPIARLADHVEGPAQHGTDGASKGIEDVIPTDLRDPFDDDFLSNGFGEFESDLSSLSDDSMPF